MKTVELANRIDIAMRRKPADIVLRQVRLFDLATGELRQTDIAIQGETIAAVGDGYEGIVEIDGRGLTAVPGFVDMHCHIESSLLTPLAWERAVLPHGTTVALCDPHELANVAGTKAIDYFRRAAEQMQMELHVQTPSCVPALPSERAGATLPAETIKPYAEKGAALAEMMNVPGVLQCDDDVLQKLAAFSAHPIDGHAPLVSGDALQALCAVGIANDHETSNVEEALEKLRAGMTLFLRCGSMARDLPNLTSLLNLTLCDRLCLCTDDRSPYHILEEGHMDAAIRVAIAAGCDPLAVYRAACLTPARVLGRQDRGLLAPGYVADIVLLSDLGECRVEKVLCKGRLITTEAATENPTSAAIEKDAFYHSVKCRELRPEDFAEPENETLVIGVQEGCILTEALDFAELPRQSLNLAALIARHDDSGLIGKAWAHGFNLQRGAIASTVGHDSHNLCVVGTNPVDMALAANLLREHGGGYAVAIDGEAKAVLPLPIGGLMSDQPADIVASQMRTLYKVAAQTGTTLTTPFMSLAFLPLPVIPHARLTLNGAVRV